MTANGTSTYNSPFKNDRFDIFNVEHRLLIGKAVQTIRDRLNEALLPLQSYVEEHGPLPCKMELIKENEFKDSEFNLKIRLPDDVKVQRLAAIALNTLQEDTNAIDLIEITSDCGPAKELILVDYPFDRNADEQKDKAAREQWVSRILENQLAGWLDYNKMLGASKATGVVDYLDTSDATYSWLYRSFYVGQDEEDEETNVFMIKPILVIHDKTVATYAKIKYSG